MSQSQPPLFPELSPPSLALAPVAEETPPPPVLSTEEKRKELEELEKTASQCQLCQLARTRTQVVFGEGKADAEIMFIGEGPGRQEDLSGRPFVGPAGQLLTRIIEKGISVPRAEVYIGNIVKCRPTVDLLFQKDRPPNPEEQKSCAPYIIKQIQIIRPKVIVAVGGPASKFLLKTTIGITRLRGKWHEFEGIPVMPIYHPSYVLRNGGEQSPLKKDVWNDIKLVMKKLNWPIPSP